MPTERMLTEAEAPADLIGRAPHEAGIEYVFGISGGHTGRIITGLQIGVEPQNASWNFPAENVLVGDARIVLGQLRDAIGGRAEGRKADRRAGVNGRNVCRCHLAAGGRRQSALTLKLEW